jgi:hypothetical protein
MEMHTGRSTLLDRQDFAGRPGVGTAEPESLNPNALAGQDDLANRLGLEV